jgi:hypothetical protein
VTLHVQALVRKPDMSQEGLTLMPLAASPTTPVLRPRCEHRAVVAYGPVALCRSCDARRSTIGKGIVGRSLAHGRDWSALEAIEGAAGKLAAAEEWLTGAVATARDLGHSWGELGAALGVTRQAAQQRFGRISEAVVTQTGT